MLRNALVGVLCLLTSPAAAGNHNDPCSVLPPLSARQEPNVPYDVYKMSLETVQTYCQALPGIQINACAYGPYADHPRGWAIFIRWPVPEGYYECLLTYEKAHLPPNNWQDKQMEDRWYGRN